MKRRFEIRFYRDSFPYDFARCAGPFDTIEAARDARVFSGDVVVDLDSGKLAEGDWRWEWEITNSSAYVNNLNHLPISK